MKSDVRDLVKALEERVKLLEIAFKNSSNALGKFSRIVHDERCKNLIVEKLRVGGTTPAAELESWVMAEGYGVMKYKRCRAKLRADGKIVCVRESDQWVWELVK